MRVIAPGSYEAPRHRPEAESDPPSAADQDHVLRRRDVERLELVVEIVEHLQAYTLDQQTEAFAWVEGFGVVNGHGFTGALELIILPRQQLSRLLSSRQYLLEPYYLYL